jgi:hypothetical protein
VLAALLAAILVLGEVGANRGNEVQAQQQPAAGPQQTVVARVAEWLGYLNNESVSGLASLYTSTANVSWSGNTGIFEIFSGAFAGQSNVRLLYSAIFANTTFFMAVPSPVNTSVIGSGLVNATFEMHMTAQRGSRGTYAFTIDVEQAWVNQGGTWLIQSETWTNYGYTFSVITSTNTYLPTLGPEWVVDSPLIPGRPAGYDLGAENESCVTDSDFLYCIGGSFVGASVYYLQLGPEGGTGPWRNTTAYPVPILGESCVTYSAYDAVQANVLCVGGTNGGSPTNQSYFAQLSATGGIDGQWMTYAAASYPIPISGASCVVDPPTYPGAPSGFVYCVGGTTSGGNATSAVYYSPLGAFSWTPTTSYPGPVDGHNCVISQRYIYCIAGVLNGSYASSNSVYYAQVSGSGGIVGGWKQAPSYPIGVTNGMCVTSGGYDDYVFCIDGLPTGRQGTTGDVYYARLSHTGGGIIGAWTPATGMPVGFGYGSCVEAIGSIWCDWHGGIAHDVILGPEIPTVTQTETAAEAIVTITTTSTSMISTSNQGSGGASGPLVYALAGTTVILAVSTIFLVLRRNRKSI